MATSTWLAGNLWGSQDNHDLPSTIPAALSTTQPASQPTTTTPTTTKATPSTTTSKPTTTTKKPTAKPTTTTTTTQPPPPPPPQPTTPPPPPPASCSSTLDGTQQHVAQAGNHILTKFTVDAVHGKADRPGTSDHPNGLALDFMVDTETGNALADYALANQEKLGVKYVIWRQQYNDGRGWSMMEDRGSITANHYDHVHVSFHSGVSVDVTC